MTSGTIESWGRTPYGQLQDNWPKNESGAYEEPAFLKHCSSTDMEDELLINMLSAYGIPCVKQYPNNGELGRVILGISGCGVDLYVPASMLDDAAKLCEGEVDHEERL